jgi:hypothetical protein
MATSERSYVLRLRTLLDINHQVPGVVEEVHRAIKPLILADGAKVRTSKPQATRFQGQTFVRPSGSESLDCDHIRCAGTRLARRSISTNRRTGRLSRRRAGRHRDPRPPPRPRDIVQMNRPGFVGGLIPRGWSPCPDPPRETR